MDDTATARADLDALATKLGGRDAAVEAQRAARERIVAAFKEAGVENEAELAGANTVDLAARAHMAVDDVEWFQAAARDAMRVELEDGASTARVIVGAQTRELPIVAASASEDGAAALERAGADAVLLQEGASTAVLRFGASRVAGLSIWRGGTRVRVALVRGPGARDERAGGGSFFSRFRSRKNSG